MFLLSILSFSYNFAIFAKRSRRCLRHLAEVQTSNKIRDVEREEAIGIAPSEFRSVPPETWGALSVGAGCCDLRAGPGPGSTRIRSRAPTAAKKSSKVVAIYPNAETKDAMRH